jgi:hypothetical protein
MASFFFFEDSTTAQTLAAGEFGFIADSGSLEVAVGDAITAAGSVSVAVYGSLFGGESAIDHANGSFFLKVGAAADIDAGQADTIDVDDVDEAFVENEGRIDSAQDALDIRGTGPITILNRGTLIGDSDGIVTGSTGLTRIVNDGTITGRNDGGIDHLDGGDSLLINRGRITRGPDYGFDADTGVDVVRNFGSIRGGVFLFQSDDSVTNSGFIDFIELGGGADTYRGRGVGRAGEVDGGGGRDTLIGSRADDIFAGGGAGDSFVYARRGGDDRIEDFGAGPDKIDLSALGLSSFAEVRSQIVQRPAGCLIDLSDHGLTLFLEGVVRADLGFGDFIL